ncbi:MAG: TIGR02186 family protein [Alphaproteobacteria bacterium]|nr:TIGR02186 family protein [Alphaproteobacteria bacterium]USO07479.1 MAG: TIGR02186 family protein [Rhodospirillales bacterium]
MRRIILTILLLGAFSGSAHGMAVDISDDIIHVTTGFNGAGITVFGTQDEPGAVVLVIEGPPHPMTVRRKSRVMGLWTNTSWRDYSDVPSFYEVAASSPLSMVAAPDVLREHHIGLDSLHVAPEDGENTVQDDAFTRELFTRMEQRRLFVPTVTPLAYPGPKLFKAHFAMPPIVTPGEYKVSAYLFADGKVIEQDSTSFNVVPEGLSADIRRFALEDGVLYGLCAIAMAMAAGWLATVLLKRE